MYKAEINTIKEKLIALSKQTKYFESINSLFGIGEFTAYCGLDPSIKQSGKSINIKGPISKSGNKYMRKILFVSVLNIIRLTKLCHQENDIESYYRKKRNEGKHHYVATIACTTKLLRKIFIQCKQLDK